MMKNRVTIDVSGFDDAASRMVRLSRTVSAGDRVIYRRGLSEWKSPDSAMAMARKLLEAGAVYLFQGRENGEYVYYMEVKK